MALRADDDIPGPREFRRSRDARGLRAHHPFAEFVAAAELGDHSVDDDRDPVGVVSRVQPVCGVTLSPAG